MSGPITAATGCMAIPKDKLRTSLANCYYFRRWQGHTWTVAEALQRVYLDGLPTPPNNQQSWTKAQRIQLRPFAIVSIAGPVRLSSIAHPGAYSIAGTLLVEFEQNVPDDLKGDVDELDRQFENFVGQVMASFDSSKPGLVELSRQTLSSYLSIQSLEDDGPYRCLQQHVESLGDHQKYFLEVGWGFDS